MINLGCSGWLTLGLMSVEGEDVEREALDLNLVVWWLIRQVTN